MGFMAQFMKPLKSETIVFKYLLEFPLSEGKIKDKNFVGPQIKKLLEFTEFFNKLRRIEKTA